MSVSPKAELLFRYTRDEDGLYQGSVQLVEHEPNEGDSQRPPFHVVVRRSEWVEFVVNQIKTTQVERVGFVIGRKGGPETVYSLHNETVSKIKNGTLLVTDLILSGGNMSQIQSRPKPEIVEGRPRQLLGMTPAPMYAGRITNSEGVVAVCLILPFGKNKVTGKRQVAIINPSKVEDLLSIPDPDIQDQILAQLDRMEAAPAELPEGKVGAFDMTEAV